MGVRNLQDHIINQSNIVKEVGEENLNGIKNQIDAINLDWRLTQSTDRAIVHPPAGIISMNIAAG